MRLSIQSRYAVAAMIGPAFPDLRALAWLAWSAWLVSGAMTGGSLTMIANAPDPAGSAVLREYCGNGAVHPVDLHLAALLATIIAGAPLQIFVRHATYRLRRQPLKG